MNSTGAVSPVVTPIRHAEIYEWFAGFFLEEPDLTVAENLLAGRLYDVSLDGIAALDTTLLALESYGATLEDRDVGQVHLDLRGEYARLFVGPRTRTAHPYASVYLDTHDVGGEVVRGLLMGESVAFMRRLYRESGVAPENPRNYPDDHVGLELAFAAWLLRDHERSGSPDSAHRYEVLLDHMQRWVPQFGLDLHQAALESGSPFYAALALGVAEVVML